MGFIESKLELEEVPQIVLERVERDFEEDVARKLKEAFPDLEEYEYEKYSRREELDDSLPQELRTLHNNLHNKRCWSCKKELPYRYVKFQGFYNDNIKVCEQCHILLLVR